MGIEQTQPIVGDKGGSREALYYCIPYHVAQDNSSVRTELPSVLRQQAIFVYNSVIFYYKCISSEVLNWFEMQEIVANCFTV